MQQRGIRIALRATCLTLASLILTAAAFAQTNSGSITGFVKDQDGAVVPNATVNVTNLGTNEVKTVQTDAQGHYEVPVLPTGRYSVEATAQGFQPQKISDINLSVGDKARVDVEMAVGSLDAIVVVADQTRTNPENVTIGDTIDTARVENLPVNGRDFTLLLATVPGSVQSSSFFQTSLNGIPTWFGQSVLVDGIDAGRGDLNGLSNALGNIDARINRVSMDSIQEVQVLEQNYSAQYGQSMGTIINPITKSGTNEFHGALFEYLRNDKLDANDFFFNARNLGKQKLRMNQFGGNLSGAILKDRLFFFGNYEGVRQIKGAGLGGFVPTAAFRATFRPELAPVLAELPLPNTNTLSSLDPRLGFYSTAGNRELRENTGSAKIDYIHSERDQFNVRYNINDSETITPFGIAKGQIAPGTLTVQLFKFSQTHAFSGSSINEFAVGLNRNVTNPKGGDTTLPRFSFLFVDNAIASPGPGVFAQFRANTTVQFLDTLSIVSRNHSFKTGLDIRLNRRAVRPDVQDTLTFFGVDDFANNAPFIAQRQGHPTLGYRNENFSFFFQDDWKALSRLTLNLGLRYEVSTVSREQYGRLQNFDLATNTYTPIGAKVHKADTNNFAPRVGLAWDVFGTQKTVLRAGYGIFYNQELPASFGTPQNNTYPNLTLNVFDALFGGFPFPFAYPLNPTVWDFAPESSKAINVIDPNLATPYSQQWSLNVQQDLGFGVLQVGYVGNHVLKLTAGSSITALNINRADPFNNNARPNPARGDMFLIGSYPQSNYHSLQANFKRRLTRDLAVNANYTWAHQIDDAVGFLRDYQDPNNPRAERGNGDTDVRHNFTFDATYNVPSLRKLISGLPTVIADGWQLNTITQMRTGFPVNVTVTGGIFGGSLRPNLVQGVSTRPANYSLPERQFNRDAFVVPPIGTYGNLARNALRGPGFKQVDFSIFKNTRLTERTTLQLRAEVFNIFNYANFSAPYGGLNADPLPNSLNPSASFGQSFKTIGDELGGLLGAGGPRQIQLAVRLIF